MYMPGLAPVPTRTPGGTRLEGTHLGQKDHKSTRGGGGGDKHHKCLLTKWAHLLAL